MQRAYRRSIELLYIAINLCRLKRAADCSLLFRSLKRCISPRESYDSIRMKAICNVGGERGRRRGRGATLMHLYYRHDGSVWILVSFRSSDFNIVVVSIRPARLLLSICRRINPKIFDLAHLNHTHSWKQLMLTISR